MLCSRTSLSMVGRDVNVNNNYGGHESDDLSAREDLEDGVTYLYCISPLYNFRPFQVEPDWSSLQEKRWGEVADEDQEASPKFDTHHHNQSSVISHPSS